MSCPKCDDATNGVIGDVYPFRWGSATIELVGCPTHVEEVMKVLRAYQKGEFSPSPEEQARKRAEKYLGREE